MPLYLVRWPNLTATLVRADDEDALEYIIDEVGDPAHASWTEYTGPLWIDFEMPFRSRQIGDTKFEIEADEFVFDGAPTVLRPVNSTMTGHTAWECSNAMLEECFPHLAAAGGGIDTETMEPGEIRERLMAAADRELEQIRAVPPQPPISTELREAASLAAASLNRR